MQKIRSLAIICSFLICTVSITYSIGIVYPVLADAPLNSTHKSVPNSPVAVASNDVTVKESEKVTLDGSQSSDPDRDALKFNWKLISPRKLTLDLGAVDKASLTFNAPNLGERPRLVLTFRLTVSDGTFLSTDFVKVTVTKEQFSDRQKNNIKTVTVVDFGSPSAKFSASDICGDETNAYSFITSGIKWRTFPVTFAVDPTNSHMDLTLAKNAIRKAFAVYDAWINPTLTNFQESSTYSSAQIKINWRPMDGPYGQLGITSYSYRLDTKALTSASVSFDSGDKFYVSYTGSCSTSGSSFDVQNIATHELGHAMNLGHVTDRLLSMYPTSYAGETLKRTLGKGDTLGIKTLYG